MKLKVIANLLLALFVLFAGIGQLLTLSGQPALSAGVGWLVGIVGILGGIALLVVLRSK